MITKNLLTIVIFFLSLSLPSHGSDRERKKIVVTSGQSKIIYLGEARKIGDKEYLLELDEVYLHDNASLVLDQSFSGKKLTLLIKDFVAVGWTQIIHSLTAEPVKTPRDMSYTIPPKAGNGSNGPGPAGQPEYSVAGKIGHQGGPGKNGRDSVELHLKLGIRKLDHLTILLMSESGGDGGTGGEGQSGGGASCYHGDAGQSGAGGKGGTAGFPGNIQDLTIEWWEKTPIYHDLGGMPLGMDIMTLVGFSGYPGNGGKGGPQLAGRECGCLPLVGCSSRRNGSSQGDWGKIGDFALPNKDFFLGDIGKIKIIKREAP